MKFFFFGNENILNLREEPPPKKLGLINDAEVTTIEHLHTL